MGARYFDLLRLAASSLRKKGLKNFVFAIFLLVKTTRKQKRIVNSIVNGFSMPSNIGYGLIVSDCALMQCVYYRISQKVELFKNQGIKLDVLNPHDVSKVISHLRMANFLIIYRSTPVFKLLRIMREAKKYGVKVFYEVDDLIFIRKVLFSDANFRLLPFKVKRGIILDSYKHRFLIKRADACIASTQELGGEMAKSGAKGVFIFSNVVSESQLEIKNQIFSLTTPEQQDFIDIYWPSGSLSHFQNFMDVSPALLKILQMDKRLRFKSHVEVSNLSMFKNLGPQIVQLSWLSYEAYLLEVARSRVVINPLRDNRFNHSKSSIKELESALVGTSFIGPPPVYASFFNPPNNSEDFYNALYELLFLNYDKVAENDYQSKLINLSLETGKNLPMEFATFVKNI